MSKKSKQKETILNFLKGTSSHPTASCIYEEVRKEVPNISLGTVYRNLGLLKQEDKILELDLAGSLSRFDGDTRSHYHFSVSSVVVFSMWMNRWILRATRGWHEKQASRSPTIYWNFGGCARTVSRLVNKGGG